MRVRPLEKWIAIGWVWFTLGVSAHFLGDVPALIFTLALGLVLGGLLALAFSRRLPELGLIPFGAIGMTVFFGMLAAHGFSLSAWLNVGLLGFFQGLFFIPLRAETPSRIDSFRLRIIASSAFVGALSASSIAERLGLQAPMVFFALAVSSGMVFIYSLFLIPEYFLRLLIEGVARIFYRIRVTGAENVPARGPVVLVCNHVSFVDWLLIWASIPRPTRFIMDYNYVGIGPVRFVLLKMAKVILIAPFSEDVAMLRSAFNQAANELRAGHVVCIFPEGSITRNGTIQRFKPGVERIIRETPVPVVPMALVGVWGSIFSRKFGPFWKRRPLPPWVRMELRVGAPIPPAEVTVQLLQSKVTELYG